MIHSYLFFLKELSAYNAYLSLFKYLTPIYDKHLVSLLYLSKHKIFWWLIAYIN